MIGSQEELTAALASLEDGGVLTLSPDIEVTEQVRIDKKNVTIVGNGATFDVGLDNAIYIAAGSSLTITGANFKGTASGKKYGITTEGNIAGLIVDSCTFTGNKYNMGHSIWINGGNSGSIVIQNSTIQRPINVHGSGSVLSDIVIQNNKFTNFGSGVFGLTITGSLKNVSILNNVYNQSSSAGLARFSTDFALSFENVVIDGNKPSSEGASGEMLYFYNDDAKTAVVAAVDEKYIETVDGNLRFTGEFHDLLVDIGADKNIGHSTTAFDIKAVMEEYCKRIGINADHFAMLLSTPFNIDMCIEDNKPIALFGSFTDPKDRKKVNHAVTCYGMKYEPLGAGQIQRYFIVNFGWSSSKEQDYSRVYLIDNIFSNPVGSMYNMNY